MGASKSGSSLTSTTSSPRKDANPRVEESQSSCGTASRGCIQGEGRLPGFHWTAQRVTVCQASEDKGQRAATLTSPYQGAGRGQSIYREEVCQGTLPSGSCNCQPRILSTLWPWPCDGPPPALPSKASPSQQRTWGVQPCPGVLCMHVQGEPPACAARPATTPLNPWN